MRRLTCMFFLPMKSWIFLAGRFMRYSYLGSGKLKKYKKTSTTLFVLKVMRNMKKMTSELNEHRYYLERNVDRRTEHLVKRIAVLEACNATLCGKLALSQKELTALKHTMPPEIAEPNDGSVKLYVLNADVQEKRTAAA